MSGKKTGIYILYCLISLCLLIGLCACDCRGKDFEFGPTAEQRTLSQIGSLATFVIREVAFEEPLPFQLPEGGDITTLERWLDERREKYIAEYEDGGEFFLMVMFKARFLVEDESSPTIRLVDTWGNRLKYSCPAKDVKLVFRLYSTGPNGIDENGGGDDIDGSRTYKSLSGYFTDDSFDGNTYRKYRDRLKIIRRNGDILIHHP